MEATIATLAMTPMMTILSDGRMEVTVIPLSFTQIYNPKVKTMTAIQRKTYRYGFQDTSRIRLHAFYFFQKW